MMKLGDPNAEVAIDHRVKERLRDIYKAENTQHATSMFEEVQKLARTLTKWKTQILAYHHAGLSNSITEAMNNLIKQTHQKNRIQIHHFRKLQNQMPPLCRQIKLGKHLTNIFPYPRYIPNLQTKKPRT